jgi:hypothetical protein
MTTSQAGQVGVLRGWSELDEASWRRLPPAAHPFETRPWLLATEPWDMRVVTVDAPDGGMLALPLVPPQTVSHLDHPRAVFAGHRALDLLRRIDASCSFLLPPDEAWSGVYSVTSPHAYRCCWRGRGADRPALRALLAEALRVVAASGGHGIALPYLRAPEDDVLVEAALDLGGHAAVLGAGCSLPVRWEDLEQYFRWLGPGRQSVRKSHRRPAPGRRRWLLLPAGRPLPDHLRASAVALLTLAAHRHGDDRPPVDLYRAVAGEWPAERLVVWTEDPATGQAHALGIMLPHDGAVVCKWFGDAGRSGELFQLCYTLVVDFAIRHGIRVVDWGGSGHLAKLLRGGELYWICGAVLTVDDAFRACLARWFAEFGPLVVGYLADLAERFGRERRSPRVPHWAAPAAAVARGAR